MKLIRILLGCTTATAAIVSVFLPVVQSLESTKIAQHVLQLSKHMALDDIVNSNINTDSGRSLRSIPVSKAVVVQRDLESEEEEEEEGDEIVLSCDAALLECMSDNTCAYCFQGLHFGEVDWTAVTPSTPCSSVVDFLSSTKYCGRLTDSDDSVESFCSAFMACAIYKSNGESKNKEKSDTKPKMNCDDLTECYWEGFHPSFIGNGVCNHKSDGCYNSAICDYDGGDCCEDTCATDSSWAYCGYDDYFCRDPSSDKCDIKLNKECPIPEDNDEDEPDDGYVNPADIDCGPDKSLYRLVMYDSFGDGWDNTKITVNNANESDNDKPIFEGALKTGSQGTEYICLSMDSSCYNVNVAGGSWGREVSWEVKYYSDGAPPITGGGAPEACQFPIAGGDCDDTCHGKPNIDPTDDPDYKTFKEMSKCIDEKCMIQAGICHEDEFCERCFGQESPASGCYAIDSFVAVVDCSVCRCGEHADTRYCKEKLSPGDIVVPDDKKGTSDKPDSCTPDETLQGAAAVMHFSWCTQFKRVNMLVTDFNQNHFGQLDKFEACAHSFANDENRGGHTALGCLSLLVNAIDGNPEDIEGGDMYDPELLKAIGSLSNHLYTNTSKFCDCSASSSEACPFCPSFAKFKTLLYESIDACNALDEIDCAAWDEYYGKCKRKMLDELGEVDFGREEHCDFFKEGCKEVGPFPAFRHLDCDKEVSVASWNFYQDYASNCMASEDSISTASPAGDVPLAPAAVPSLAPVKAPTPNYKPIDGGGDPTPRPVKAPTQPNYVPTDNDPTPNYVPTDGGSKPSSSSEEKKKKEKEGSAPHYFRNFVLLCLFGGAGYYAYKRRADGFQFIRYRRMRPNFGFGGDNTFGGMFGGDGGSEMYNGLSMESSTTFEPPSLPPPPTMMGGTNDYNYSGNNSFMMGGNNNNNNNFM